MPERAVGSPTTKFGTQPFRNARASPEPKIERNYNIEAAMEKMRREVPKLKPRPKPE